MALKLSCFSEPRFSIWRCMASSQSSTVSASASALAISASESGSHQPSLHSRNASPSSIATEGSTVCGSTASSTPSAAISWFFCGWLRASSGRISPPSTMRCTTLSSRVITSTLPWRNRYRRESPTWDQSARSTRASIHSTTTVVCMRCRPWAPCWRLCNSAWAARTLLVRWSGVKGGVPSASESSMWVTARREASAPCSWPPAPSASTAYQSCSVAPQRKSSSLALRRPTSLRAAMMMSSMRGSLSQGPEGFLSLWSRSSCCSYAARKALPKRFWKSSCASLRIASKC